MRGLAAMDFPFHAASRDRSARPGPLEIETADAAVDVENFSGEEKSGTDFRLHGPEIDFFKIDPAGGDFRFGIADDTVHAERKPLDLTCETLAVAARKLVHAKIRFQSGFAEQNFGQTL